MTPPALTRELLALPAPRAIRLVARDRMDAAAEAFQQLQSGGGNALHDFRVALRRLRSWLRAFRPELEDTLRGKTRRALGRLARQTNAARDAEIGLTWITGDGELQKAPRGARRLLLGVFTREFDDATKAALDKLERKLPKLLDRLDDDLAHYWLKLDINADRREETMAAAMARVLEHNAASFGRALDRVHGPADFDNAHRARIAGKRLRYLLEVLEGDQRAANLLKQLTQLQDALGEFRDTHALEQRAIAEGAKLAKEEMRERIKRAFDAKPKRRSTRERSLQSGLVEIAVAARRRGRLAFLGFEEAQDKKTLTDTVTGIAEELRAGGVA